MSTYPTLVSGSSGLWVRVAQRALWRALGNRSVNLRNGQYGVGTIRDCATFQAEHGIAPAWGRCGPMTWPALDNYFDATCKVMAAAAREQESVVTVRQEIVHQALWTVQMNASLFYSQTRPIDWACEGLPVHTDCSGLVIGLHKCVKWPVDPSGNRYNGAGWTGDLIHTGEKVSFYEARAGDLVHYGDPFGHTGHVAIAIDDDHRQVVSFGGDPGQPVVRSYFYRGDYDQTRRHLPA